MRYVKIQNHGVRLPNYLECILQVVPMVHGSTYRKSKKKYKAEWVCNNYDTVSQTNWEYHTKTFSVPIKLTERKWNITFYNHVALEAKHHSFN